MKRSFIIISAMMIIGSIALIGCNTEEEEKRDKFHYCIYEVSNQPICEETSNLYETEIESYNNLCLSEFNGTISTTPCHEENYIGTCTYPNRTGLHILKTYYLKSRFSSTAEAKRKCISSETAIWTYNSEEINFDSTYDFGTYTDNGDGAISFKGAGELSNLNLVWMKCAQGQIYNPENNDCTGSGNIDNTYNAQSYEYCTVVDVNCKLGSFAGDYSNAPAFKTCDELNTGSGNTWRLPTFEELKSLVICSDGKVIKANPAITSFSDKIKCESGDAIMIIDNSMFPNGRLEYWSSDTSSYDNTSTLYMGPSLSNNSIFQNSKDSGRNVRCVATQ